MLLYMQASENCRSMVFVTTTACYMGGWMCINTKWPMGSLQVRRTQLSHCALRDAPRVHTVDGYTKHSRMHPQGQTWPHGQLVAAGHTQRRQLLVLTTLAAGPLIRGDSCIHAARNNQTCR